MAGQLLGSAVHKAERGDIGTRPVTMSGREAVGGNRGSGRNSGVIGKSAVRRSECTTNADVSEIASPGHIVDRRSEAAHDFVIADVQEVLELDPPSERPSVFSLEPAKVVVERVVLAVPDALPGVLRIHVDGYHSVRAALLPDLKPGRGVDIDSWDGDACPGGNPRPPVAH